MARKLNKQTKRSFKNKSTPVHIQEIEQSDSGSQTKEDTQSLDTESTIRRASVDMLKKALELGEISPSTTDVDKLVQCVEAVLFSEHKNVFGVPYKAAVRRLVFNLRRNQDLRLNVLSGSIKPGKFAVMTSQEMASEEMKKLREKFMLESILEHQKAEEFGTPSDMFRCHKCGNKNCTYTQAQTRCADEPMTTFVYCRTCGQHWKFS